MGSTLKDVVRGDLPLARAADLAVRRTLRRM